MKINIDTKKGKEAFSKVLQKTTEVGKKAVTDIQQGAKEFSEKQKQEAYLKRLKKYNPLFPEVFQSEEFKLPNVIVIVDEADRRDVDVCKGAIGWIDNENGIEVLCLYDEAVQFSGINFVPVASCDSFYYVDNYDRNRFIKTDCIFDKAHDEKLAELQNIAYLLGAKRCSVELNEGVYESVSESKKASVSQSTDVNDVDVKATESMEQSSLNENSNQRSGAIWAEFDGCDTPVRPNLKWFAHDDSINNLIDMRCNGKNMVKHQTLKLSGSNSSTMSEKAAYCLDVAMEKIGGIKAKSEMTTKAKKEHRSKLIYYVEF